MNESANSPKADSFWVARYSKAVLALIVVLAAIGTYTALSIPIAVFPSTNFPRVLIGVDNGVMPIDQMLVSITRPLEEAVSSVPGLNDVRSTTSRGSAEIDLFFDWNVDMFQTLERVNSAVNTAQSTLPSTAKIETHRLTFASFPILGFSLTSDTMPQTKLWELATYQLKPRLNRVSGVATVTVQGGAEPEYRITPDPIKLLRSGVTVTDILDAIRRTNLVDSPGLITDRHKLILDLVDAQVHSAEQLAAISIKKTASGAVVHIGDLADVQSSVKPVYTVVTANTKPAVLININRQPSTNTVAVSNGVYAELANLRSSLPPGVKFSVFYDQSELVKASIKSVRDAILIGIALAVIVLIIFLRDWGSALVAGLVIPITIAITCVALKLLGESFNLMTLGGLAAAVGLVIDDAIVVVENIVLHRDAGEGRIRAIHSALGEITKALVGSTVTPIVVFLPLVIITGVTGTFFRALAIAMASALLTSFALALTWTPSLSQFFVKRKAPVKRSLSDDPKEESKRLLAAEEASMKGFMGRVINVYERVLKLALDHRIWLGASAAILIVISYFSYRSLGSDLLPPMDEGGFVLDYIMPAGSSLDATNRVVQHVEQIIRSIPEVESTSRRTGLQLGLAAVTEANTGDISVKLKSKRSRSTDDVISEVRADVEQQEPALHVEFVEVLQDMIGDLTSAPQPVDIKLFSEDPQLLREWAPKVADKIKSISGVVDVLNGIENTISSPADVYRIDPDIATRTGFTPEEVSTDATAVLLGDTAPNPLVVNNRPYNIRIRFPEKNRASIEAMSSTLLASASGTTATLGTLSHFEHLPGQTEIQQENLQRDVAVTSRLEGTNLGSAITKVKQAVASLKLPESIRVEYGGTYKTQQNSFRDLMLVLLLGLLLVFLVLLFEFRTFSAPLAILSSAVLSTSGVFLALMLTGTTFNVASFMGLIMVVGIVSKNGILLLDADEKFRAAGMSPEEAMIQAGRRRLRPIMMTALAAVAGMLPLALALGAGSQMLQPLAIAVMGGIVISMALSLIITPAVHFYLNHKPEQPRLDETLADAA
jgi:CzcA family heavy metal efflux pump